MQRPKRVNPDTYDLDETGKEEIERYPWAQTLVDLVLGCEKDGHRAGWDSPFSEPHIFMLTTPHVGNHDVRAGLSPQLTEGIAMVANLGFDGNPGEALAAIGEGMLAGRWEKGLRYMPILPPTRRLFGLMFRSEGWGLVSMDDPERAKAATEYSASGRRFVDHPERQEFRMIQAVTSTGVGWSVFRQRGERPKVLCSRPGSETGYQMGGNVPRGMTLIYNAIAENPIPVPTPLSERDWA